MPIYTGSSPAPQPAEIIRVYVGDHLVYSSEPLAPAGDFLLINPAGDYLLINPAGDVLLINPAVVVPMVDSSVGLLWEISGLVSATRGLLWDVEVTAATYAFSDEMGTLSLDVARDGGENWSWRWGWDSGALDANADKAWKTYADHRPTAGAQTAAEMGLVVHEATGNGTIKLYARPNPDSANWFGYLYLGGMISTYISHAQTYGTWECRARFKATKGQHWAMWLVQQDNAWPPEIDMVEIVNDGTINTQNRLFMNRHLPAGVTADRTVYNATNFGPPAWVQLASEVEWQDWHVYKFVWTATLMEWWVDGVLRMSCPNYINLPMYFMISPEIGGNWPGLPDGSTTWPAEAEIDYVRITAGEDFAPVVVTAPAISGNPAIGWTLTATSGVWSASPAPTYSYQWKRGTTNVGTNQSTYVPVAGDAGSTITVTVTATNSEGQTSSTSAAVGPVSASGAWTESWTGADGAEWDATKWTGKQVSGTSLVDIASNQGRIRMQGSAYAYGRIRSLVPEMSDFDLTVQFTLFSATAEQYHRLCFRTNGAWSFNNNDSPANGYEVGITANGTSGFLGLRPVVNSVRGTNNAVAKTWNTTIWNLRVQAIGSALKVKAWQGAEPPGWDIEVTDATFASGGFQWASVNGSDAVARTIIWDNLSITPVQPTEERVFLPAGSDDAEEQVTTGTVDLTSTDLEMGYESSIPKLVGLRFVPDIPVGATIVSAYVQFTSDNNQPEQTAVPPQLMIKAEAADNGVTFAATTGNISGRTLGAGAVNWTPPSWYNDLGQRGSNQRTADITALVQEWVDRPGRQNGHAFVLVISSVSATDSRVTAFAQQSGLDGPELVVVYQ